MREREVLFQEPSRTARAKSRTVRVRAIPCEVYSRVVGYYRPVQNWNDGKKEEFRERKYITF